MLAVLLAVDIIRLTVARSDSQDMPERAARLAPNMPESLMATAMAEVGGAAAKGESPPSATFQAFERLSAAAPLSIEPFLLQGAVAEKAGDISRAERLLVEARRRNPRSTAARYLLADAWLRQGRVLQGLEEMAILARLLPGSAVQLVPALSGYARSPGARDNLKRILTINPQLQQPLLTALASDSGNAELVLDLAGPGSRSSDPKSQVWQSRLLNGLIAKGAYARAYALWRQFAGLSSSYQPLLFNGEFKRTTAPPPFNWSLVSGRAGLAEPGNANLRVLYYGRQNATLASQLLLLPAGNYQLTAPTSGTVPQHALRWTLTCEGASGSILTLEPGVSGASARFAVPASGCSAQTLRLDGQAQEMPQTADVLVGPLRIDRVR